MMTPILSLVAGVLPLLAEDGAAAEANPLSVGGWVTMVVAVGGVTLFLGWCVYKVLSTPGSTEHIHTQADIDTHDTDT